MIKKILSLSILLFCLNSSKAQEKNNVTLGIEPGIILFSASDNLAFFLNVEPKIKSSKNTVIGLRIGATVNSQSIENKDRFEFNIDDQSDNGVISFVPTVDYFFNETNLRPNVGLGVGYYLLAANIDASRVDIPNPAEDVFEISVRNQIGLLLRGGLELGSVRLGLEYNFVPTADIEIPNGQIIGTVDNSYFGLSIGFTIGEKKNSK